LSGGSGGCGVTGCGYCRVLVEKQLLLWLDLQVLAGVVVGVLVVDGVGLL